jgi:hypothetical protein
MSCRKIAESNLIRNNRIVQTIQETDFNKAVLSIGDCHEIVIQLLRETGMSVSAAKNLDYGDYLPRYYEEKLRGWKTKPEDENIEAVHAVLSRVLIKEYVSKGFGSVAHCGVVARSTLPKTISMDVYKEILINGPKYKYSIIEGLKAVNINVPDTKEEFLKALKQAGVYGCR